MCTACSSGRVHHNTVSPHTSSPAPALSSLTNTECWDCRRPVTSQCSLLCTVLLGGQQQNQQNSTWRLTAWMRCFFLGKILTIVSFLLFIPFLKHMLSQWCLPRVRGYSTVTWPSGLLWLCCGLQKEKLWNMRLIWKRASGQREGEKLCKPSKLVLAGEAL